MYIRNKNGDNIPPYGTPFSILVLASPNLNLHLLKYHIVAFVHSVLLFLNLVIFYSSI